MPAPRRRPKALLSDDTLHFEFFLGEKLRMSVARLRHELSQGEFVYWTRYYLLKAQNEELALKQSKGGHRG